MDEYEINEKQIILSIISIGTILVSIILLYNDNYRIINKHGFINNKDEYYITLGNKIILCIVFFLFLIINYNNYIQIKEHKEKDSKPYLIQVIVSIITVIAALLALYAVLIHPNKDDIENPIV